MCQNNYTRELTRGDNHPIPLKLLTCTIAKGKATGKFGFIRFECGFHHWLDFLKRYHPLTQEKKGLVEKGPENCTKVKQFFTLNSFKMTWKKAGFFRPELMHCFPLPSQSNNKHNNL